MSAIKKFYVYIILQVFYIVYIVKLSKTQQVSYIKLATAYHVLYLAV